MRASEVARALRWAIAAKRPAFLWGPPGVGKSAVVQQVAAADGRELRDVRAALLDPVDMRGLPFISEGVTYWANPCFLPKSGRGLLFFDELPAAVPMVQATLYQLVLDGKLGEYVLPPDWVIVAAGNRETDRAISSRMSSALANRFAHLSFEVNAEDWQAWALGAGVTVEVVAFLRFRPALLHVFDPKRDEKAFPTPRTWEFVSDFLRTANGDSASGGFMFEVLKGVVGEGAAAELAGFLEVWRTLPDLDAALLDPSRVKLPDSPAVLYAVASALPRKVGASNADRAFEVAGKMPIEFQVVFVRDTVRLFPQVQQTRAFISWAAKNQEALL